MSDHAVSVFHVVVCIDCGGDLTVPFAEAGERRSWLAAHTAGSGHDRYINWTETRIGAHTVIDLDRLYLDLKGARERLARAQTSLLPGPHRQAVDDAVAAVDRLGAFYCGSRWSADDLPTIEEL